MIIILCNEYLTLHKWKRFKGTDKLQNHEKESKNWRRQIIILYYSQIIIKNKNTVAAMTTVIQVFSGRKPWAFLKNSFHNTSPSKTNGLIKRKTWDWLGWDWVQQFINQSQGVYWSCISSDIVYHCRYFSPIGNFTIITCYVQLTVLHSSFLSLCYHSSIREEPTFYFTQLYID